MANIIAKGEAVYKCDTCSRSVRVPINKQGLDIIQRCIITANCLGNLHRVITTKDINDTPSLPPEVVGVQDWFQRNILYTHTQSVRVATWNIEHNLTNKPNIYVYVHRNIEGDTLTQIEPKTIKIVDLNNVQLTFDQAESGIAQCIALSSRNTTNPNVTTVVAQQQLSDTILTNTGELTIATLDSSLFINVEVSFNNPGATEPVVVNYTNVSTIPNIQSPWAGVNYIVVNGKKYYVRSFNILTSQPGPAVFQSGDVISGATVRFPNSTTIGQTLILLANAPYSIADRIYNKFVDVAMIGVASPQLYYNAGNLYTNPSIIKDTYPLISTI